MCPVTTIDFMDGTKFATHRDRFKRSQDFREENISNSTSSERSTMDDGAKRAIAVV